MNIIGGMRDSHAVASEGKKWENILFIFLIDQSVQMINHSKMRLKMITEG